MGLPEDYSAALANRRERQVELELELEDAKKDFGRAHENYLAAQLRLVKAENDLSEHNKSRTIPIDVLK